MGREVQVGEERGDGKGREEQVGVERGDGKGRKEQVSVERGDGKGREERCGRREAATSGTSMKGEARHHREWGA